MSAQEQCITSCSRIPVIRKNSNQSRSLASHFANSVSSSSFSYTSGSSSTNRGQSFLPSQAPDTLGLQERHYVLKLVVDRAGCLFLFVTQVGRELQEVFAIDVFNVELWAGL